MGSIQSRCSVCGAEYLQATGPSGMNNSPQGAAEKSERSHITELAPTPTQSGSLKAENEESTATRAALRKKIRQLSLWQQFRSKKLQGEEDEAMTSEVNQEEIRQEDLKQAGAGQLELNILNEDMRKFIQWKRLRAASRVNRVKKRKNKPKNPLWSSLKSAVSIYTQNTTKTNQVQHQVDIPTISDAPSEQDREPEDNQGTDEKTQRSAIVQGAVMLEQSQVEVEKLPYNDEDIAQLKAMLEATAAKEVEKHRQDELQSTSDEHRPSVWTSLKGMFTMTTRKKRRKRRRPDLPWDEDDDDDDYSEDEYEDGTTLQEYRTQLIQLYGQ